MVQFDQLQESRFVPLPQRLHQPQFFGGGYVCRDGRGGKVVLGYGVAPKADFWLAEGTPNQPHIHVAFRADNHAQVDEFYRAALAAGGRDNGAPGPRPHYHEKYYGAFVLDPDGHNIEVVCHG